MGAAAIPLIASGVSAGAGLIGSGKAAKAQSADASAAQGLYNQEADAIKQLLGNYFSVAPTLQSDLLNFSKTQQPEIQQLSNTMGASDQSLLQSIRSQIGGVPNPGAMIGGLARNNAQNEAMTTQGMESQLVGQNLSALESLGSFVTAPLASSIGGLQNMGNTYQNAASAYGNPWQSGVSGVGNFIGMLGNKSSSSTPGSGIDWSQSTEQQYSPASMFGTNGTTNTNPYSTMGPQP